MWKKNVELLLLFILHTTHSHSSSVKAVIKYISTAKCEMDAAVGGGLTWQDWFILQYCDNWRDNFISHTCAPRSFFIETWNHQYIRLFFCTGRWNDHRRQCDLSFAAELGFLYLSRVYKTFRTKGDLLNSKPNETWRAQHLAFFAEKGM